MNRRSFFRKLTGAGATMAIAPAMLTTERERTPGAIGQAVAPAPVPATVPVTVTTTISRQPYYYRLMQCRGSVERGDYVQLEADGKVSKCSDPFSHPRLDTGAVSFGIASHRAQDGDVWVYDLAPTAYERQMVADTKDARERAWAMQMRVEMAKEAQRLANRRIGIFRAQRAAYVQAGSVSEVAPSLMLKSGQSYRDHATPGLYAQRRLLQRLRAKWRPA